MIPFTVSASVLIAFAAAAIAAPATAGDATPPPPPRLADLAEPLAADFAGPRKVTQIGLYDGNRVMQLQLKAGAELGSHASPDRVLIVVLGGRGHFDFDGEIVPLRERQVLHMAPGEPHAVVAETDLDLLLVRIPR